MYAAKVIIGYGLTLTLLLVSGNARAELPGKVQAVDPGEHGVTLTLTLDAAPFPDGRARYTDSTVLAFVPATFEAHRSGRVDFLLHYHGHQSTAREAMRATRLDQQVAASGCNAVLVVPQLAVSARDSSAGRLEARGGVRRLVHELIATLSHPSVAHVLGDRRLPARPKLGHVLVSAHSGGFQGAAYAVSRGGVPIREVYLFDALYGFAGRFADWLRADPRRRLVSYHGGDRTIGKWTRLLERALDSRKIPRHDDDPEGSLSRATFSRGRAILVKTSVPHPQVPFGRNALRDCLRSSPLSDARPSE